MHVTVHVVCKTIWTKSQPGKEDTAFGTVMLSSDAVVIYMDDKNE